MQIRSSIRLKWERYQFFRGAVSYVFIISAYKFGVNR